MASNDKALQIREIKNYELWAEQIWYWRTHLDVFIEEYFHVKLKDVQRVEARAFGNCDTMYFVQSRGFRMFYRIDPVQSNLYDKLSIELPELRKAGLTTT